MLHVNDDSNDEIFRKAANDYFLDAGNPDFNKFVTNADSTIASSAVEKDTPDKKRKHYYLFSAMEWAHGKIIPKWPLSFFRIFWQRLRHGKTKKKLTPGLFRYACIAITTGLPGNNNLN